MRSSKIRLRKQIKVEGKRFANHKVPCTAIWQQPLQFVLALRSCSAMDKKMKAQSHLWLWHFGAIWGMGMLSSCICSMSVCAMKLIPIVPLAQWGKELAYYLTPLLCLENWDMYYPGGACQGKDLPPSRVLYIHRYISSLSLKSNVSKLMYSLHVILM